MDLELVKETVLNTVPTDVRVVRTSDSKELGRTSLKLILSSPEVVLLEKDGYKPVPLTLEPNQTYKINMEALEGFLNRLTLHLNLLEHLLVIEVLVILLQTRRPALAQKRVRNLSLS